MGWQDSSSRKMVWKSINEENLNKRKVFIPDAPKQLMQVLLDAGYEAYVVGGCVRDFLLGQEPHDWDICTNALPDQMKECFANYRVIETGLQHGTLTVMVDHVGYEITTYRIDGEYTDHRHPDSVQFVGRLQEDLMRRDFTVNAMAADISGKIRDFYDGQFDLEHKWIRCVGDPDKRFTEDPLRIFRAMRFESKLGFAIEEKTEDSMRRHRYLLQHISAERINTELTGILMGDCYSTLACFPDILSVCIAEIKQCIGFQQNNPHHNRNVWDHTLFAVSVAPKDIYTRLALLYHDIGKPLCYSEDSGVGHFYGHAAVSRDIAEKSLRNLRFDNQTIKLVTQLVEAHDRTIEPRKPVIRRCLNKMGMDQFLRLLDVKEADYAAQAQIYGDRLHKAEILQMTDEIIAAQIQQKDCFTLKDLAVNGNDLIQLGYRPGKKIGIVLNQLLEMVIDGTMENDKTKLLLKAGDFNDKT